MSLENKFVDINQGKLMVVSDIHGNWNDYQQAIQNFEELKARGEADFLIFEGDLIHGYPGYVDDSRRIIDDLIERGANQNSDIVTLLGNHDMIHIYHIMLQKGSLHFTIPFEQAIQDNRGIYMDFLKSMPFAVRTAGGVMLIHSGASAIIGTGQEINYGISFDYFKLWPHDQILNEVANIAFQSQVPFHTSTFNPYIGKIFGQKKRGQFLWEVLMNKNEYQYGEAYFGFISRFLEFMGTGHSVPLNVLVSGHIEVSDGVQVVCDEQLRISSGYGSRTDSHKKYLLIDASKTYTNAYELASECRNLYH